MRNRIQNVHVYKLESIIVTISPDMLTFYLQVVKLAVNNTKCKCHGISGACTVKTCWRQLSPFRVIGNTLKQNYENSYKVVTYTNKATGKSPDDVTLENNYGNIIRSLQTKSSDFSDNKTDRNKQSRKLKRDRNSVKDNHANPNFAKRSNLMWHLDDSPTFCDASPYGYGTEGRVCNRSNCDVMCCGRGYNIRSVTVKKSCQCHVIWCCDVKCKQCVNEKEVYLCK